MLVSYQDGLKRIKDIICDSGSVILLTHRRPDGDTVGSACALAAAVRKLGKNSKVLYSIFSSECEKHNVMYDPNTIFTYLNEYPEKSRQLSLFDV